MASALQPERADEYEEVAVVRLANAVVKPLAMVVKTANTTVALATVLACPMRIPLAEFAVEVVFPERVLLVISEGLSLAYELRIGWVRAGSEHTEQDREEGRN